MTYIVVVQCTYIIYTLQTLAEYYSLSEYILCTLHSVHIQKTFNVNVKIKLFDFNSINHTRAKSYINVFFFYKKVKFKTKKMFIKSLPGGV